MDVSVLLRAFAKVNLYLEVRGRRADGFHDLETLMVAVRLADTLHLRRAEAGRLTLTCSDPTLSVGSDNLICQAATRLRELTGCTDGATIHLTKRIPMAAGLAGGSSDAATTLRGLNRLWNLGLSLPQLHGIAADLGSDVAFFLHGSAAWCTGRGEIIEPVPARPLDFVLVCPARGVSTSQAFGRLTMPTTPRDRAAMRAAYSQGDPARIGAELFNRLQEPAEAIEPQIAEWHARLRMLPSAGSLMSGSGSSLFALAHDRSEARRDTRRLKDCVRHLPAGLAPRVYCVRSCV